MSVFSNEERVQILKEVVAFKTVNNNELEVCEYFQDLFKKYGIDSRIEKVEDNRANLIAEIGEGSPVLGLSGHMDVVSEGNPDEWTYDPFTLTEDDGYLYGRGAGDMKSGLVALAIALIEVKESGSLKNGKIKFMATTGEEKEQLGSKQMYENGEMDEVDALIIAEPSEKMMVYAHKGSMDFRITSRGKSSHSSMPVIGKNAIKPLVEFIQNIDKDFYEISKQLNCKELNYQELYNYIKPQLPKEINQEDVSRVLYGPIITNTIIKGGEQVNSVPDRAVAEFNVRTVPEYDNDMVKDLFNKHIERLNSEGACLENETYLDLDPVLTTGENDLMELSSKLAKKHFDYEILKSPTVGVTDASNLLRGKDENFSFLMFGPGERAHQINERVSKNAYLSFINYYIELFIEYFSL
ncbi:succinyl-diaminopimelate desuccinylase [Staphylococcus capitis]|uniref:ArgE/DapE family deacylase n=1 Tax=Staphylococcus capitis TaxID=29388 RepID=UPI000D1A230D|nr:ArgE/DapE family deacylase [Staphylococcus capitis]PTG35950.1 succinyl-diaminopimelate desuccinylase [Staphylococcus capitis]PTH08563.1 succinyl-diaminopimelate desuccinylase [Staphylococcus capitis]RIM46953.1 ArgE/DapE family deacylase [Staphylococcus capitis]